MVKVTIVHHLGLGDHIMICGLARSLQEQGHDVYVIVLEHQAQSIRFMYRDTNINVLVTPNKSPQSVWSCVVGTALPLATYGIPDAAWAQLTFEGSIGTWAHVPYLQAGVNPHYMRKKFRVNRDLNREQQFYQSLHLSEKYVFVHRDSAHTKPIEVETDLEIVYPDTTSPDYNIFDWILVIENAQEVHCANSGPFPWLIELLELGGKHKNFFHLSAAHQEYSRKCVKNTFSTDIWTFKD
jgi:hypothetical protein